MTTDPRLRELQLEQEEDARGNMLVAASLASIAVVRSGAMTTIVTSRTRSVTAAAAASDEKGSWAS